MGSGCSLGQDILHNVCTPEDIDNKIKNYFQQNKRRQKRRSTKFLINTSDEENDYDENDYDENYYDENNTIYNEYNYNDDYNNCEDNYQNNLEDTNEYNNNFKYKNKYIKKYRNPLSKQYIHKKTFNLEPLSLDIFFNYKKINKKLNDKNCELRLTKLLLQGKEDECENLKKSINCIATNSVKY